MIPESPSCLSLPAPPGQRNSPRPIVNHRRSVCRGDPRDFEEIITEKPNRPQSRTCPNAKPTTEIRPRRELPLDCLHRAPGTLPPRLGLESGGGRPLKSHFVSGRDSGTLPFPVLPRGPSKTPSEMDKWQRRRVGRLIFGDAIVTR
ncbi:hypothetical protein GWI33_000145 [Rhynchophorus ferrugineus]|uniref:Uncharacterized protein n=1 Tax=Rhynchophorus ferrugineus TaxID=354439 RepID=A0A834IW69_RHYFE|nr:hypothetical protein GWI33_000145 [Rhynchophorus ferrugineus]